MDGIRRPGVAAYGETELVDAHSNSGVHTYINEMWDRRGYAWYVAQAEVRQRQIMTVFGSLWHLLNPLLSIGVYFLVFGLVLKTDRGVDGVGAFLLFLTVGLFIFQFTQRAITQGSTSLVANQGLVQAIRFPRALLPLSATLAESLAALPTFGVIVAVALAVGELPTWRWLLLPVLLALQAGFNLGAALIAARLTTHFRDTQQILPFVFRLLIYGSGVFYSVDEYISDGPARLAFILNPVYDFITLSRWAVMGTDVTTEVVFAAVGWGVLTLVVGFFWFRAAEHSYHHV